MKTKSHKLKFQILCESIAQDKGVGVMFFEDKRNSPPHEDDGNLHVTCRGLRACFGIGQDTPISVYNDKTTEILTELGLKKFIGPDVLLDENCPFGCDEQGCQGECEE